jgi:hypothetical protein
MRNLRVPLADDQRFQTFASLNGCSYSHVLLEGRLYTAELESRSELIQQLCNDLSSDPAMKVALTFRLRPDGALDTSVSPDEGVPLAQFVDVVARPDGPGRVRIELHGFAPDFTDVVVDVATLPARADASVTMKLLDLDPSLQADENADAE